MNDPWQHLGLFLAISVAIVTVGAFYSERDDRKALESLPRRFATFVLGCGVLAAIMLICEYAFASVH